MLTITVSPAFAAKWLLPRIDRFQAAYPDTDVRLNTTQQSLDFLTHGIDIGVRYGAGRWTGLSAAHLMDEEIFPVCAPSLMNRDSASLRSPVDLARYTLIHDLTIENNVDFPTWETWLAAAGYSSIDTRHGLRINNSAAVLQAAIEGQGVALARSVMVADDLAAGRLVRPFPLIECPLTLGYYVVVRPDSAELPRIAAFRDWLLAEAAGAVL